MPTRQRIRIAALELRFVSMITLCATLPAAAQDTLIVRKAPNRLGGYYSDTLARDGFGYPTAQLMADCLRLAQTATVGRGFWYG